MKISKYVISFILGLSTVGIAFADADLLGGNIYIDTMSGALGIGTSTPKQLLTVYGSDALTTLTTATDPTITVTNGDVTNGNYSALVFKTADTGGAIVSGTKFASVFTSHTPDAVSADLTILTRNAGTLTEHMRLTSTGTLILPTLDCTGFQNGGVLTTSDSGAVVCQNDDGGGGGSPGGSDTQIQYNDGGAFGGSGLTWDDVTGRFGIGTTSPSAFVSVASSTYNYLTSLFRIGTTTGQTLVDVYATSTGLLSNTSGLPIEQDSGARIRLGASDYYNRSDQLDQIILQGRVRNSEWFIADCPVPVGSTAIAADGQACDSFSFGETTATTLTGVAGNGYSYGQLGGVGASDGAMVALNGATAGFLRLATSTPSLEVTARIGAIVANSSTTAYVIGFSSAPSAAPAATEPATGCFFIASSTMANWHATCRTALGAGTKVDTGVASTSIITGAGSWKTFRIDADSDNARFFIKNGTGVMTEVANISTTYPTTQALNAGISFHRGLGTAAIQFDFFGLNVQWRKFTPNL